MLEYLNKMKTHHIGAHDKQLYFLHRIEIVGYLSQS